MAYVYLVKLFGMHKIGRTDNFERRMEQLQPAVLVAKKAPTEAAIWRQNFTSISSENGCHSPNSFRSRRHRWNSA